MKLMLTITFAAVLPLALGQSPSPTVPSDKAAQREHGRAVFSSKCGQCHNQDGMKKLPDGSTLLGRLSLRKDPQAMLGTRLKSMTAEDRSAVSLYVEGLLTQFRSENK